MTTQRTDGLLHWGILAAFLVNALWIIWIPSFPTLDGWSHLHTARMLFDGPPEGVFCANPDIVPNRMGHLVLGLFTRLFEPLVAERIFLALLLFGIGGGAYALMRALGGRSPLILLVLPFTVSFMLVLGFHNYLLGMALAFAFAAWWISRERITWPTIAGHLIMALVLFYTHTTALVLYFMLTGSFELALLMRLRDRAGAGLFNGRWKGLLGYVLSSMPALMLFSIFTAAHPNTWGVADGATNLRDLFHLRSLLLYHFQEEEKFLYATKVILVTSGVAAVIARFREASGRKILLADIPLAVGLGFLALYFILPDSAGYASYITVRFQWMALTMFVVWIALQRVPLGHTFVPVAAILLIHAARNGHISDRMAPMAYERDKLVDAAKTLPEGSVVLTVRREDNWMLAHTASLLATQAPVVLLDNYETTQDYFPLILCGAVPGEIRGHMNGNEGGMLPLLGHITSGAPPVIDRIVVYGRNWSNDDPVSNTLAGPLAAYFKPGYANDYVRVFERR